MIRLSTRVMWLLLAGLVAGCATTPSVDVASDPATDFSQYRTFTFHSPLGTDRDDGTRTVLSQRLRSATRMQLEGLGYEYVDSGGADLIVNFFVETKDRIESTPRSGIGFNYGFWRSNYGVWRDYEPAVRQYTVGTLHVDVVDEAQDQLIWEAAARERLASEDFSYAPEEVDAAIRQVFSQFPMRRGVPGQTAPQ